ncbi:hypothetical protein XENTR_v10008129 [Xenopus tropicalis]|nr:hypothetical protein XENTR_v10008129 [Xenopus tropicalis]
MRKSASLKPTQMRKAPSPTHGWKRDGVSPRPAPIGNCDSPQVSRVKNTSTSRPLPVGNNAQLTAYQRRSTTSPTVITTPMACIASSLRPNPVGDSGSPRLPPKTQAAFPRPPPIGHSASPRLPRLSSFNANMTDNSKSNGFSVTTLTNMSSAKSAKKKPSVLKHEAIKNTPPAKQKIVAKNSTSAEDLSNLVEPPATLNNKTEQRPVPVGNASSQSPAPPKSYFMRYTALPKPHVINNGSSIYSTPMKIPSRLGEAELRSNKSVTAENYILKRPTPLGISPSSTLKKSLSGKSALKAPSVNPAPVNTSLTSKLDLGQSSSHQESTEYAVPKIKSSTYVSRIKCVGNVTIPKLNGKKDYLSPVVKEMELSATEKKNGGGNKFSPKQKAVEKHNLSIQKSAGSVTFQRPKQAGNTVLKLPKSKNAVSPIHATHSSTGLSGLKGHSDTKPQGSISSSLSKVMKNIPSAKLKLKDNVPSPTTKPSPIKTTTRSPPMGIITSTVSKPSGKMSLDRGKPVGSCNRAQPKTVTSQILPRLSFMQKKSTTKTALIKDSSRAGENDYLLSCPGRANVPQEGIMEPDNLNLSQKASHSPGIEDNNDFCQYGDTSWSLTDESLRSALLASTSTFKPIQDEHLVLVRPRLMGPALNNVALDYQYRTSKTKDA